MTADDTNEGERQRGRATEPPPGAGRSGHDRPRRPAGGLRRRRRRHRRPDDARRHGHVEPRPGTTATTPAEFDGAARCTVTPEQVEGPYYFDVDAIRRDIREDRDGTRLRLAIRVRDAASCEPIPDAVVDVRHADAQGGYSGFDGGRGGARTDTRYLRGAQVTDAEGIAEFVTIYPGCNDSDGIFDESLVMTASRQGSGYRALMNFDVRRS